jgi:fluoroquinolone resistance protein
MSYHSNQTFQNKDFTKEALEKGEYESYVFNQCNFSGLDLSGFSFENCSFISCDLSNVKVFKAGFQQVTFKDCKILGVHFHTCNPFLLEFSFDSCQLDYCSFFNLQIKKTSFHSCRMREASFTQADVSGGSFRDSDLTGVIFDRTILEKADFRNAQNFSIDPELNRIKGAFFDLDGLPGLLGKYGIKIG